MSSNKMSPVEKTGSAGLKRPLLEHSPTDDAGGGGDDITPSTTLSLPTGTNGHGPPARSP